MTATTVRPKPKAAVPATPAVPPAPSRRRGFTPLTPMRSQAAKSMRRLAAQMAAQDPTSPAHQHIRDAARTLESGNEEAAQRHLRAAMFSLTPQSLHRNGAHDDDTHIAARQAMHGAHRHLLLVKDIVDAGAKNQQAIRRDSYGDDASAPVLPHPPFRPDPNAGYGPGALAQKPTARQPGGDRALNAPDRTNSGGSDPAVADPVGPQPKGSKQFARTWGELWSVLELSARTAQLEVTPAPRGKPGGPGLYDVKSLAHSPYFQQIVKALIEKRGMPPGRAYAIAYGALRKWRRGGGKVHPEVRAAATGALADEAAKGAMAKAVHGHANTWDELAAVIDLAWIAHPDAAQWAAIDAKEGRVWKPDKVRAADLVTHKDGSVTGGKGKVAVGSLSREGGKYVAHHGSGTVTRHASKSAALQEMAARHNKAASAPPAAAPKPAAAVTPVKAAGPAPKAAPVKASAPAKVTAAGLVTHKDGTVTSKTGKTQVGKLSRENGKWVAQHGDGTVSKHADKATAMKALAAVHNKGVIMQAAGKPAPAAKPEPPALKSAAAAPPKPEVKPPAVPQEAKSDTFVKPSDLTLRDDGSVVSKKTGADAGAVRYIPGGLFEATHADGTTTTHKTQGDAVKAIAGTTTVSAAARVPKPGELTTAAKQHLASIWSNSYRYSNESFMNGKEGEDFTHELHRMLATNTPPKTCGKGCQEAHKFLGLVDQDATVQHTEIQRGISLSTKDAPRMFQPGKTVDMPAASWTTRPEWADSFADKNTTSGETKVILHTAPGAKGLDLSKLSLFSEGEVVTGGRYSVDKVQTTGGVMHVYVTQQALSAH